MKKVVKQSPRDKKASSVTCGSKVGEWGLDGFWMRLGSNFAIRELRRRLGWSALELARAAGKSQSYIKHLESVNHPWVVREKMAGILAEIARSNAVQFKLPERVPVRIITSQDLPGTVYAYARARPCAGHGRVCFMRTWNQKYCADRRECRRLSRRKGVRSGKSSK